MARGGSSSGKKRRKPRTNPKRRPARPARSSKAERARRLATDPEAVEDDLRAKMRAAERATSPANFSTSRDAMAALTVVRAIERALELAEVEDGSLGLKRALRASSKPLGDYVARHMDRERKARRRKA